MIKAIIFLGTSLLAGSVLAQGPNGVGPNNYSNIFINVNNDNVSNVNVVQARNVNVQPVINLNVQQSLNVNKPKPPRVVRRTPSNLSNTISNLKPKNTQSVRRPASVTNSPRQTSTVQAAIRRPIRPRRPVVQPIPPVTNIIVNEVNFPTEIQVQTPIENPSNNQLDVNKNNEQEIVPEQQIQQMQGNIIAPQVINNMNEDQNSFSINLPKFNKPQVHFVYSGSSNHHKSISAKKSFNKKWVKITRKFKTKHGGKLKKYIIANCCTWN